jgi:hypothetical protein
VAVLWNPGFPEFVIDWEELQAVARQLDVSLQSVEFRTPDDFGRAFAAMTQAHSPFYDIEGQGWFLGLHVFTHYVKVTFFRGTSLRPVPPGGTGKDARWIDIHEDDLDEAKMATWVKQAAAELPEKTRRSGVRSAPQRATTRL